MVSSTVGSLTKTGWKRRSRAASFSMYFRYSSSVVAPIACNSPRASAALESSPQAEAERATKEEQAAWRKVVKACVPPLIKAWEPLLQVQVQQLTYRNMKSRWGSCQPSTGKICINTRLALYPPECLEYVVVHEMCHLLVANHGPEFKKLLTKIMPDWKSRANKLRA